MSARLRRTTATAALLVATLAGGWSGSAHAAPGDLAYQGCIGATTGCIGINPGGATMGAYGLALAPDGRQLYLAAHFGGAIDRFALGGGGPLQLLAGCNGVTGGCTPTNPSDALGGARGVVVSTDGRHLYAAAYAGTVSHFTLDASGVPTFESCLGLVRGCTPTTPADALRAADALALSPDGRNLYVAAENTITGAVSRFTLAADGRPTFAGCYGDLAGCTAPPVAHALDGAVNLVVSPSGRRLYVASATASPGSGNTIATFALDVAGTPTWDGCLGNLSGCTAVAPADALGYPHGLALSADGSRLYVGVNEDVAQLAADAAGELSYVGCVGSLSGCTPLPGSMQLNGLFGLALSPDDTQLYATVFAYDALMRFALGPDGRPAFAECFGALQLRSCTTVTPPNALAEPLGVLPSRDGTRLYVTSYLPGALDQFAIEQPAPPSPPAPGAPALPGALPPAADTTAPQLSRYSLSHTRFAAAGAAAASRRAGGARPQVGTTIRYALSEPATVTFTVERSLAGRRAGRRCVAPSRRNRRAARCTRATTLRGDISRAGPAGRARVPFDGRLRGRRLAPGAYRLVARARDAAGNASPPARAAFRIVPLRR